MNPGRWQTVIIVVSCSSQEKAPPVVATPNGAKKESAMSAQPSIEQATTVEPLPPTLNDALLRAVAQHPERTWNLLRGATIVAKGGVTPAEPHGWWVSSQFDTERHYHVYYF